jgi:hypothetical protein
MNSRRHRSRALTAIGCRDSGGYGARRRWSGWIVLNLPATSDAFAICNTRLLELARREGPVHLIALWDGKGGDGPGGTADMVSQAAGSGDHPHIIAPQDLLRS